MKLTYIILSCVIVSTIAGCKKNSTPDSPATDSNPASLANWDWMTTGGGTNTDYCRGAAADEAGNVYVTGDVRGNYSLAEISYNNISTAQCYIVKFNKSGALQWNTRFQGVGVDIDASKNNGDVFVTGTFAENVTLNGISFSPKFGNRDAFVMKLDTHGQVVWVSVIGSNSTDSGNEIVAGADGAVAAIGPFDGGSNFTFPDQSAETFNGGDTDVWLALYNPDGTFRWGTVLKGNGHEEGRGVSLDANGYVLVCGEFDKQLVFGSTTLQTNGQSDVYIAKYTATGNVSWARKFGSAGIDAARGIDPSGDGGVIVSGEFSGTIQFDQISLTSVGGKDIFLVKLDENGNVVWAKSFGSTGDELGSEIEVDKEGNIYTAGSYFSGCILPNGVTLNSNGKQDQYLIKWSSAGVPLWWLTGGGTEEDINFAIAQDNNKGITVVGAFKQSAKYASFPARNSIGNEDLYIAHAKEK